MKRTFMCGDPSPDPDGPLGYGTSRGTNWGCKNQGVVKDVWMVLKELISAYFVHITEVYIRVKM